MDTVLIGITVLATTAAIVATAVAWRLAREARALTAARVAALSAAAGPMPPAVAEPPMSVSTASAPAPAAPGVAPAGVVASPPAFRDALDDFVPLAPAAASVAIDDRFLGNASISGEAAGPQRWLAVAAAALLVVLVGATVVRTSTAHRPASPAAGAGAAATSAAPLELVVMRHTWRDGQLAVEGDLRTPGRPTPAGLEAVALLFDRAGGLVTSAVAPVTADPASGPTAHFSVSLAAPATAARYRVSFRSAGAVVPHVDLRGSSGAAPAGQVSANR